MVTVDAWLWAPEFDDVLAIAGHSADSRSPAAGEPIRCLLYPNPYLAEQIGALEQSRFQQALGSPKMVVDVDADAIAVTDPNDRAFTASARLAQVTATPSIFAPDGVLSGDGTAHDYLAIAGLVVSLPGVQPLIIGCLDRVGSRFRYSWRENALRRNERPAYVVSAGDMRSLAERFGVDGHLADGSAP